MGFGIFQPGKMRKKPDRYEVVKGGQSYKFKTKGQAKLFKKLRGGKIRRVP